MKKLFAIPSILFLGYSIFAGFFENSSKEIHYGVGNLVLDSFEVRNIYSYGQIPLDFGTPDTIGIQFLKKIAGPRIIKLQTVVHNDSANGPIKEIHETLIDNTSTYDTIVKVTLNSNGTLKTDFIVVEALPGDVGIILKDDTLNNVKEECYNTTSRSYNHASPCISSNVPFVISSTTANYVAAFRNKHSTPYYIQSIDYAIFSSSNAGIRPFKIVVYADNGSGKPGSLVHSSDTLYPPTGTIQLENESYVLKSPVGFSPGQRFYVGYKQLSANPVYPGSQPETPVRPNAFYFSKPQTSGTWYDFRDSSMNSILDITVKGYTGVLNLHQVVEAMYPHTNDSVTVYLYTIFQPRFIIDSAKALDSSGTTKLLFANVYNGADYYLAMKHRNSLRTWSALPVHFVNNTLSYDFTSSSSQAFGNNMTLVGSSWCIYSGDVNNDGAVDLTDVISIYNDASSFASGYIVTDLTNDNFVDLTDLLYCYNNAASFVSEIQP